jgi:RES domain
MTWRWSAAEWTPARLELAHAVYARVRKESAFAPMQAPLGPGNLLLRSFDRKYIGAGLPDTISGQLVLESIRVRDAAVDQNRFSGAMPAHRSQPAVFPRRGGLYCSEDIRSAIAELFEYASPTLARSLIGRPARLDVFKQRCFVSLRAVGELDVVSLNSSSPAMLPFFKRVEDDPAVAKALAALRYKDLFDALYRPQDYAAARGMGLGLESNPAIDGVQVISARDYETDAGGQRVMRTGDNVMLYGLDQRIATDKVRIEALTLVDAVPGSAELLVTRYRRSSRGHFRKLKGVAFMP